MSKRGTKFEACASGNSGYDVGGIRYTLDV